METKNDNQNPKPKQSWFERNLWWIALFLALFLVRMCNVMARHY